MIGRCNGADQFIDSALRFAVIASLTEKCGRTVWLEVGTMETRKVRISARLGSAKAAFSKAGLSKKWRTWMFRWGAAAGAPARHSKLSSQVGATSLRARQLPAPDPR
jgi:hypothetical protein